MLNSRGNFYKSSYNKAFTLIELMVVISILALLSSVVAASLKEAKDKAKVAAGIISEKSLYSARGDKLRAEFKFNNSLADSERSGYTALITGIGTPIYSPDTPHGDGYSLYLPEERDYSLHYPIDELYVPPDEIEDSSYTVGLWFKTDDLNGGLFDVFYNMDSGYPNDRRLYLDNGRLCARLWYPFGLENICSTQSYSDNEWHYVIHTYGGQTGGQELYVDGNLVKKGERTYSFLNNANDIHIGGGGSEDNLMDPYNGYIDGLVIYDSALGG